MQKERGETREKLEDEEERNGTGQRHKKGYFSNEIQLEEVRHRLVLNVNMKVWKRPWAPVLLFLQWQELNAKEKKRTFLVAPCLSGECTAAAAWMTKLNTYRKHVAEIFAKY